MRVSEKTRVASGGRIYKTLLLMVAVLGLFSLAGCVSAPYMVNPMDVAAGSEDDPLQALSGSISWKGEE